MPIPNRDDDEFRAMGYVTIYAAYVEEYLQECFNWLEPFDPRRQRPPPWQASRQVESCRRAIRALPRHDTLREVDAAMAHAKRLLRDRNYAIHSPLYALPAGGNVRRPANPAHGQRFTTAADIYDLAESLFEVSNALIAASVRLPRAIHEARRP